MVAALCFCLASVGQPPPARYPPYPPSPVIAAVRFAPEKAIIRKALGSDNWPITWADDDCLYCAYGDGWGFEPGGRKLSLGFCRISGAPPDFSGSDIPSPSGERLGDGARGPKASGMLMVDAVLYMLVRNVKNSQLAWSSDHGKTWTWAPWRFTTSFGCPTFLNFGKNYAGARDNFVYVYSQDGPSAYKPYDHVVLARVPKDRLREREAYQFFAGLDARGRPRWTPDITRRASVLEHPGRCYRMDVVYHPGLRRYLLCQAFGNGRGGWAIFDAPEPWGPWTTAFYTEDWGLGNIHGFRLPTKWIDPRGNTMWLVFSGRAHKGVDYDAFCLRRCTLVLRERASEKLPSAGS